MLVQQVKEPIAKGGTNCICKNQYQNSAFQSPESLNFEHFSQGPAIVGLIVDSGCERKSNPFSVNSA